MIDLLSVLLIVAIVAFVLYKNINKITKKLDMQDSGSHELYSKYASIIQEYIRKIRKEIESPNEDAKYILLDNTQTKQITNSLSDMLRKLVFFETLLAKQKSDSEIEEELFHLLSSLDKLLKEKFKNGETLADELRDKLYDDFNSLKRNN